jgi:hypothetical protein
MATPDQSEFVLAADGRLRLGETDHERPVIASLQRRAMPRELRAERLSGAEALVRREDTWSLHLRTASRTEFHTQTIRHDALLEVLCSIEVEGSRQEKIWSGSRQLVMR